MDPTAWTTLVRRTAGLGTVLAIAVLSLGACGGQATTEANSATSAPSPAPTTETAAQTSSTPEAAVTVTMRQAVLEPGKVEIEVGDAVTWRNNDNEVHGPLFIYEDGDVTKKIAGRPGPLLVNDTWTYVFDEPGRYQYVDKGASLDVISKQWILVRE